MNTPYNPVARGLRAGDLAAAHDTNPQPKRILSLSYPGRDRGQLSRRELKHIVATAIG